MKGLVLCGGKGTRLRPLTFTRPKHLIPIANKPTVFYCIDNLIEVGISEIGIVISPENGEEFKAVLGDGSRWGAQFSYIVQDPPLGLAHAVSSAREFIGDQPFITYLGDNLFSGGIQHMVAEYEQKKAEHIILLSQVDNPSQFGVAVLDDDGSVVQLVEKPKQLLSNLALVGVYLFSPSILEVIANLKPSARGEFEITDAIQMAVSQGQHVVARNVCGWWKDTGRPEDLLDANRLVLSHVARDIKGCVQDSEVIGEVVIESGARVENSCIRGPVHIAAHAEIRESYIGPYTAIGCRAKVIRSQVEYSALLEESEVIDVPSLLDASVLGQGVKIHGTCKGPRRQAWQFILGDRSSVQL